MKQYIKNKPVKWGFKLWCRCDAATGYLFEFDLYTGKRTSGIEYGLGESVILQLTRKVEGLGCEIYMDNFFNSPLLQYKLVDQNTKACGTVRINRKYLPKSAPIDRSMKRGDIYTASFHGISYVKWMDNKAVHLLTNFLSPIEIDTVKRRKAGSADKIDVRCPRIVSH
ncbi:PiggyBac transposable element-derived protein 4 [Eumeta japonica]|uniref:PiggyBac transposable element-derived protein 4 n=1 Tax=Eumeta variegata TaxID=151549 RepID=A0A4C2A2J2_EUMVA|nr:PiggyBac transposable element-derived protein 4 [Eumeta japonica]